MKIAPTLIIGIGGTGSRIVSRVMKKVQKESRGLEQNLKFAVLDTDANDLAKVRAQNKSIITVQTSVGTTVEKTLQANPEIKEWFPQHPALASKVLTQGAGQVRAVSRLALESCITQGKFSVIHDAIRELNELSIEEFTQSPRVIIVGTITGGTGAGLALPLGMHLRHYFEQELRRDDAIIRGFFILPGVMTQIFGLNSPGEMASLNRNAYAVLRELNAFMRKGDGICMDDFYGMEFTLPSASGNARETYHKNIKPYDYCFLLDAQSESANYLHSRDDYEEFAANTIYAQSLSPMSAQGNSSEDNVIQELVNNETSVPGVDKDFTGYISGSSPRFGAAGSAEVTYPKDEVLNYVAEIQASRSMSGEWLAADEYVAQKQQEEIDDDVDEPTPEYVLYRRFYEENDQYKRGVKDDFVGRIANMIYSEGGLRDDGTRAEAYNRVDSCLGALNTFIMQKAEQNDVVRAGLMSSESSLQELLRVCVDYAALDRIMKETGGEEAEKFSSAVSQLRDFAIAVRDTALGDSQSVAARSFTILNLQNRSSSFHPIGSAPSDQDVAMSDAFSIESFLQGKRSDDDPEQAPAALHPNAIRLFFALLEEALTQNLRQADDKLDKAKEAIDRVCAFNRDWDPAESGTQTVVEALDRILDENVKLKDRVITTAKRVLPFLHVDDTTANDELAAEEGEGGASDSAALISGAEESGNEILSLIGLIAEDSETVKNYLYAQYQVSIYRAALQYAQAIGGAYKDFYSYLREQIPALHDNITAVETSKRYNITSHESDGVLGQTTRYVCCNRTCLSAISNQVMTDASSLRVSGVLCADIYKRMYQYAYDNSDANMNSYERSLKTSAGQAGSQARHNKDALNKLQMRRRREAFDQIFQEAIIDYWKNLIMKKHSSIIDMDIIDAIRQEALYMDSGATEQEQDAYIRQVLLSGFSLSKPLLEINRDEHMRDIQVCMFSNDLLGGTSSVGNIVTRDERKLGYVDDCLRANSGYADPNLRKGRILYYQCVYGVRADRLPRFSTVFDPVTVTNDESKTGNYFQAYHEAIETLGPIHENNNLVTPHINKGWHYITSMPELSAAEEYRQKYDIMRAFLYSLVFGKITRYKSTYKPQYKIRWKSGDVEDLLVRNGTPCDDFYEVFDGLNYNPKAVKRLNDEFDKSITDEVINGSTAMGPRASLLLEHLRIVDSFCKIESALDREDGFIDDDMLGFDEQAKRGKRAFILKEFGKDQTRTIFDIPLFYSWSLPKTDLRDATTVRMVEMCFDIIERYLATFSTDAELDQNIAIVLYVELMQFIKNFEQLEAEVEAGTKPEFVGISNLKVIQQIKAKGYAWFDSDDRLIDSRLKTKALRDLDSGSEEDSDV